MNDVLRWEYEAPRIEIFSVQVECTNISDSGTEANRIDPVSENSFEEIL